MGPAVQPLAGAFSAFGGSPAPAAESAAPLSKPLQPVVKAFDPFAPSPTAPPASGLSSEQLLGNVPATSTGSLFKPAQPSQPLIDPFASQNAMKPSPAEPVVPLISSDPKPSSFFGAPMGSPAENAPTRPILTPAAGSIANPFTAPKEEPASPPAPKASGFFAGADEAVARSIPNIEVPPASEASFSPALTAPAVRPEPAQVAKPAASGKSSFLGLTALDTDTDQLLLRALLGVEDTLDASRVVQLLATQPGLSACVCLNGSSVLSHSDSSVADAATFQQQAADIARQLRGLAPLIGIEGAETFTLNAGGRLLTFCFPGDVTVGVLHRGEPGTGLRDKITLVARELARMLR